jgi:hypothetical protein
VADFKSEWPGSNRNRWPPSFRNQWPTSSGISTLPLYASATSASPATFTSAVQVRLRFHVNRAMSKLPRPISWAWPRIMYRKTQLRLFGPTSALQKN